MENKQKQMPEGWEDKYLANILSKVRNGFSGEQVDYLTNFPVTRIETISNGVINFDKVGYVKSIPSIYKLKIGDILLSNINSVKHIGKIAFVDSKKDLYHGMNLLILQFSEKIDSLFIYYYLYGRKKWFEKVATQAINQASINQTTLKELDLIIPKSTTEQKKIAEILSKVDTAIEQTQSLIAKYQRIKTGLMQDLLTKGIDENGNIRSEETHEFKDSELGRIPKEWDCLPLIKCMELHNKLRKPISAIEREKIVGTYPYFGATGIIDRINKFTVDGVFVLFGEDGDHFLKWNYQEQTIFVKGKFNVSNHAHIVKGNEKCSTEWIHHFFMHRDITFYLTRQGAGRFKLNKEAISNLPILVPKDPKEIEIISTKINSSTNIIQDYKDKKDKLQSIKTALMQDLLSGKKRVTNLINEKAL